MSCCRKKDNIGPILHCTSHEIRRALDMIIAAQVSPELTGMRGMVLGHIARGTAAGNAIYQRDIETEFHIRRSSVTTLLQGMEQAGFVTRSAVQRDARLKSLVPTEKGQACVQKIDLCIEAFETRLQAGLSKAQLDALRATLGQLVQNVREIAAEQESLPQERRE